MRRAGGYITTDSDSPPKMAPLRGPEANVLNGNGLLSLQIQSVDAKFFVYKTLSAYQFGHRGEDFRLPLFARWAAQAFVSFHFRSVAVPG